MWIAVPGTWALLISILYWPLAGEECKRPTYENQNQIDYGPLRVRQMQGTALDSSGVAVPDVCIGLFAETDNHFITSTNTDSTGRFFFRDVPKGVYRLVAKCPGFGVANARVRLGKGASAMNLIMRPNGIDSTSYAEVSK